MRPSFSVRKRRLPDFTPPGCASLAIFPDENSEPDARTTVIVLGLTIFHHGGGGGIDCNGFRRRTGQRAAGAFASHCLHCNVTIADGRGTDR